MTASTCIAPRCGSPRELGAVFCSRHLTATPAQRGGWLSAERRRRQRGNHTEVALDASNIARRLWVGGKPPFDRDLPAFDTLVLCAEEIQPEKLAFGRQVLRIPLPDAALDADQTSRALAGGHAVAESLAAQRTVLVTCHAGINRSALIACLGLGLVTKMSATELIELMRLRRDPVALSNRHFCMTIYRALGSGRRATR